MCGVNFMLYSEGVEADLLSNLHRREVLKLGSVIRWHMQYTRVLQGVLPMLSLWREEWRKDGRRSLDGCAYLALQLLTGEKCLSVIVNAIYF